MRTQEGIRIYQLLSSERQMRIVIPKPSFLPELWKVRGTDVIEPQSSL